MARLSDKTKNLTFIPSPQSPDSAGFITVSADDTVPAGWLECNGQAVSRTEYAELFALIGETYGAGDGSTTFNLPGGDLLNNAAVTGDLTVDTDTLVVDSANDRVGIGTASPDKSLHIQDTAVAGITSSFGQLVLENDGQSALNMRTDNAGLNAIYFGDAGSFARGGIVYDHATEDLQFRTANNSTKMTIAGSGTTSLNGPVFIWESSADASETIQLSTPAGNTGITFNNASTGNYSRFDIFNVSNATSGNRYLNLSYNNESGIAIRQGGRVGIGTTSPDSLLHVFGTSVTSAKIQSTGGTASSEAIQYFQTNSGSAIITRNSSAKTNLGGASSFNIRNDSGGVFLSPGATSWSSISDMRFKTKVADFTDGLNKLLGLSAFTYTLNEDEDGIEHLGMSAQEVLQTVPEAISGDPEVKMGIMYDKLVPVLVKAVQELKSELDTAKAEIEILKGN